MMLRNPRISFAAGLALVAFMRLATPASAGSVTFNLNTTLSGTMVPNGSTLSAVITDVVANEVTIKMDATNLSPVGPQFISNWGFNIDPALDGSYTSVNLTASLVSNTGGVTAADLVTIGNDNGAFNPPSGGSFDVVFAWLGSNHTFQNGSIITYDLKYTGAGTFSAASFNFPTTDGDNAYTLAKIQGFGSSGELGQNTPGTVLINGPNDVPELDAGSCATALASLSLGLLMLRGRAKSKSAA